MVIVVIVSAQTWQLCASFLDNLCYTVLCDLYAADNRVRAPRKSHVKDFSIFNQPDEQNYPRLSPQLALATFQYLSTCMLIIYSTCVHTHMVLKIILKINFVIVVLYFFLMYKCNFLHASTENSGFYRTNNNEV